MRTRSKGGKDVNPELSRIVRMSNGFYVLALSQNNVQFFEGTRYSVKEVELENVPKSLDEALQYEGRDIVYNVSTFREIAALS